MRLQRIRRPALERYGRFVRRVSSWEPHVGRERNAEPPYGAATSQRESALRVRVLKESPEATVRVIRVRLEASILVGSWQSATIC